MPNEDQLALGSTNQEQTNQTPPAGENQNNQQPPEENQGGQQQPNDEQPPTDKGKDEPEKQEAAKVFANDTWLYCKKHKEGRLFKAGEKVPADKEGWKDSPAAI